MFNPFRVEGNHLRNNVQYFHVTLNLELPAATVYVSELVGIFNFKCDKYAKKFSNTPKDKGRNVTM